MYHRITTQCTTEPAWYIFHSCGNFCGTRLVQQGYHTNTTGHLCTTGLPHKLPQSLCGIFFIPVVISVVLTCTTGIPHKYHRVPHKYHRLPQDFFCKGLPARKRVNELNHKSLSMFPKISIHFTEMPI